MNRHLRIAVRRGGRFKRTKRILKAMGYTAAAIALCTATDTCPKIAEASGANTLYSKFINKVDRAVKRKVREIGKEYGAGMKEGLEADRLMDKADRIGQEKLDNVERIAKENMETLERVIKETGEKGEELLQNIDNNNIMKLAGYFVGGKRDEEETKSFLQRLGWG